MACARLWAAPRRLPGTPEILALGVVAPNDPLKPIPIAGLLDREEKEVVTVVGVEEEEREIEELVS